MATIDKNTALITRFDIFERAATEENDAFTACRLFAKRSLIGELDVADCVRYEDDFDTEDFKAWIAKDERTVGDAMDYLGEEVNEIDEEEERDSGSIVPEKYRLIYGAPQNCGDAIAVALSAHVTLPRATKKDADGGLDRAKLYAVAQQNGLIDKYEAWLERDLNGGLLRMNTSNVLRGMNRRGEEVTIGEQVWPAHEVPKKVRKARAKKAPKAK